jgi:putative hydrolase of the HAD superfamily
MTSKTVLIFDLDGCLYDHSCGYTSHIRKNVLKFMIHKDWAKTEKDAYEIWWPLFQEYNQSKRALKMGGYDFTDGEYWAFMRSGTRDFLKEDKRLQSFLDVLPQRKFIMSNCAEKEAKEALECLGVTKYFEHVYGADFMGDICKPDPKVFEDVCKHIGTTPSDVVFFEDSYKNLATAKRLGMRTVFVEGDTADEEAITEEKKKIFDAVVSTLSDANGEVIKSKLPDIFHEN